MHNTTYCVVRTIRAIALRQTNAALSSCKAAAASAASWVTHAQISLCTLCAMHSSLKG